MALSRQPSHTTSIVNGKTDMARHFGFAKRNRHAVNNDDLLMPTGPIWVLCLTVIAIVVAATLLR
jgi:hypothetical protein